MSKCKEGETWFSSVNHQPDGTFEIDSIDAQGNFTGTHGQTIRGQCKGGRISYTRWPYVYDGTYTSDDEISGWRYKIILEDRVTLADDDEWSGTHVTKTDKDKAY